VNPTIHRQNPPAGRHAPARRIGRRHHALAAIATLSLVAAACGYDDTDTAAPATTSPAASDTMSDSMSDTMSDSMSDSAGEVPMESATDMSGGTSEAFGPACSAVPADGEGSFAGMADDPAATAASNNPVLSTLVGAVQAAGLVDTLNGDGPFTIFAPTNDAFAAIPPADLDAVLADQDLLTSILTYHVVAGESLGSADLVEAGSVETVQGGSLTITDEDGTLTVNGVPSVCMDVPTANATVHIIGGVLMPDA
jgi:uncharacterized surface protein with fasciclin (FAS1) repeats